MAHPLPVLALAALACWGWRAVRRTQRAPRPAAAPAAAAPSDDALRPLGLDPEWRAA